MTTERVPRGASDPNRDPAIARPDIDGLLDNASELMVWVHNDEQDCWVSTVTGERVFLRSDPVRYRQIDEAFLDPTEVARLCAYATQLEDHRRELLQYAAAYCALITDLVLSGVQLDADLSASLLGLSQHYIHGGFGNAQPKVEGDA